MSQVPPEIRAWYRNPDGSCVQCSGGMHGIHMNDPATYTLLWDSKYGRAERGGSYPSRVSAYARARGMPIWNITGEPVWEWMRWAARTGRLAVPIGAGAAHFQCEWGWDPASNTWYVHNNNGDPAKVTAYSWTNYQRLHRASGEWLWLLDKQPPPECPRYSAWWNN